MARRKQEQGWLGLFEQFVGDVRIVSKEVKTDDPRGAPLEMWESQRRFVREVADGLDRGVHTFNCLKSRQLGVTTISLAIDVFWLAMHSNMIGCIVTDTEKNRDANRMLIEHYVKSFPEGYFGESFQLLKSNRQFMHFSNGCRLDLLVAGVKKKPIAWGQGQGYGFAHLCVAPGTPVLVSDGRVRLIEDVEIGDQVLTHTGAPATVIDKLGQPNNRGDMIRINPWLGHPVTCSKDHTIPTQRGIVYAKDLTRDDWLLMPVRPIVGGGQTDRLPADVPVGRQGVEKTWVRRPSFASGKQIEFDEEVGFAVGYYLAEGSVERNKKGVPTAVTFSRHRNESSYARRAMKALGPYGGRQRVVNRPNSFATTETISGTPLAKWMVSWFGAAEEKHIPDEVFGWGVDFCRGLLCGLLSGDGSKTVVRTNGKYDLNLVVLPTTRSSIAMQARDIVASLGMGWGACDYQAGGVRHGRVCRPQWRVRWSGSAASRLRELIGLPALRSSDRGQREKYRIEDGLVLIKIRALGSDSTIDTMWDLSVDHEDHTFRTPWMAVGNTEVGNYAEAEGIKSLEEGFAQSNPDRLFVYESTAKGYNHWRTKWYKGLEDDTQHSFFIGWWSGDTNRIERSDVRFAKWGTYPVTYEERELVRAVQKQYGWKISSEQLAWYRWKQHQAHAEQDLHQQNQPFTAEQAFVQTGYSFFQNRVIGQDIKRVVEEANGDCAYIAYEYECGPNFLDHFSMTRLMPGRDAKERIQLKVWEEPHPQGQYAIGCDPAYGRNDHKDGHSLSVWRCYADQMVQVAEFLANDIEVKQFAWVLFHLCAAYNNTMSILELGGPGRLVMAEFDHLKQMLSAEVYRDKVKGTSWEDAAANARWYLYHKADSPGAGYLYNFETTWRTKMELMHSFRGAYMSREMLIRSRRLLDEMLNVQVVDDRIGAPESTSEDLKDDRVFAAAFANRAWQEWIRREMLAQGLTKEVCDRMEADSGSSTPAGKAINGIVERFLLSQAQRAAIPVDDRPSWLVARGLA